MRFPQVEFLEREAFEVLRLVRSMKNSFAPVNRIPPEVLSLIPDHYGEDDTDQDFIALTHVCRGWRNIFISRASLWIRLKFKDVEKTRTYIQRSQSSPLKLYLDSYSIIDDAFSLMIPHIRRVKSLTVGLLALPDHLEHFRCQTPLLEKLEIHTSAVDCPVLDGALFDGDLSRLRELRLERVNPSLPWTNLANLRVLSLKFCSPEYTITRLLDLLETTPLLHTLELVHSTQGASDAPPERIVLLPHIKVFTIDSDSHSTPLYHLHIPIGASLISRFNSFGDEPPLLDYLSKRFPNFSNLLSHITAMNFLFNSKCKYTRLSGPSGSLRVLTAWERSGLSPGFSRDYQILSSLGHPMLSAVQRLTISKYEHSMSRKVKGCAIFQTLSSTNNLQTLSLISCGNQPFIRALDPEQTPSNLLLCPRLEDLTFYIKRWSLLDVEELIRMVGNRTSRGAKLSSIVIVGLHRLSPRDGVLKLGEYVTHMEYRVGDTPPDWDDIFGEGGGGNE